MRRGTEAKKEEGLCLPWPGLTTDDPTQDRVRCGSLLPKATAASMAIATHLLRAHTSGCRESACERGEEMNVGKRCEEEGEPILFSGQKRRN